jgi:uncharacterized protein (TIGR02217 family)
MLTFPALMGQGWSVHKRPTWTTLVAEHVSGREVRDQLWQNPRWEFELLFDGLDGTPSGQYEALGAQSLQQLLGFFLQCGGRAQPFLYFDPTDYSISAQQIGVGDGSTTGFALVRTIGGFSETVVAPVIASLSIQFPGGATAAASAPTVSVAGIAQSPSTYTITSPGGILTLNTAPASGAAIVWSGFYAFLCRFDDDKLDFEQFMANLWKVDALKFTSLRSI